MTKLTICVLLCLCAPYVKAQTAVPQYQPYGKIDKADLEMPSCDFEKDANAEVLFDVGNITPVYDVGLRTHTELLFRMDHHVRYKIFNEFGEKNSNVRIIYPGLNDQVTINDLRAETINLENGKTAYIQVDKKSIYRQKIDKIFSALVFAFPEVKPGSVIEYEYNETFKTFPTWYFQCDLPTRYSEYEIDLPNELNFKAIPHVSLPYVKNVGESMDLRQIKALANVHSLPDEPFMDARKDNLERIEYFGKNAFTGSWDAIGRTVLKFSDFGDELGRSINGESGITKLAKDLKTDDEKIAFIFDTVKNSMKWDESTRPYVVDGTKIAWDKKTGNSTEINLIVYNLLKKAGIKAYPMIVSTKKNGKINPANPDILQFNNTVVYIPVDSTKFYVLDASSKFNLFNTIPTDELNSFGLDIDHADGEYKLVFLEDTKHAIETGFFNAGITADGKMTGTADITSYNYNKINALQKYKTDGEKKYIDSLRNNENNIKISSLKLENMDVDSLPLTQHIDFSIDLTGSDENYIYFNTNLFNLMGDNPFTKEERFSDIDFGYMGYFSISGIYKLPPGFKTDALPKNITIISPDQSLIFKRTVAEGDGSLMVKYILDQKKTVYFKEGYQDIRGFYKKMYELLNEQVVLKKSS